MDNSYTTTTNEDQQLKMADLTVQELKTQLEWLLCVTACHRFIVDFIHEWVGLDGVEPWNLF